jgi:hypothetical protein
MARIIVFCSVCNEQISLETSKTDENGKAVHEECYFMVLKGAAPIPPSTHFSGE